LELKKKRGHKRKIRGADPGRSFLAAHKLWKKGKKSERRIAANTKWGVCRPKNDARRSRRGKRKKNRKNKGSTRGGYGKSGYREPSRGQGCGIK